MIDRLSWPRQEWDSFIDYLRANHVITASLYEEGTALARRSTTLSVRIVQGKLKAVCNWDEFELHFPLISKSIWRNRIIPAIVARPSLYAQVLANMIPAEMGTVFASLDIALFQVAQIKYRCTCDRNDHQSPCKHVPAVLIRARSLFQHDPFSAFALRGIKQEEFFRWLDETHSALFQRERAQETRELALPTDPRLFWEGLPTDTYCLPEQVPAPYTLLTWQLQMPSFTAKAHVADALSYVYEAAHHSGKRQ